MPPLPKSRATRQRRNKPTTAAKLNPEHSVKAPPLPKGRTWHSQTKAWWKDIWASPMAPEFINSDIHGLFALAILVDDFWTVKDARQRKDLVAEIRLQRQCFGLTPIDRRRLQWEVGRVEEAQRKQQRRTPKPRGDDPYGALRAVK
jgi:hypothetical protein